MSHSVVELATKFQSGCVDSFTSLVSQFQNLVTSVAYANLGDIQKSEDVAQKAFLLAWQKKDELSDPERFSGWLYSITRNLARNENRLKENVLRKTAVNINDDRHHSLESLGTPETHAIKAEQNEMLWETLDRIPLHYREPLVLFYREDCSVAEVAEQLSLSEDAVKQRLKRGRAMLKSEIENLVENFLINTKPGTRFTSGVIASLPTALGAKLGSVSVKATAGAAGAKLATSKATTMTAGTWSLSAMLPLLLTGIGGLVALGVSWINTRAAMKRSNSELEKKVHFDYFHTNTLVVSTVICLIVVAQSFVQGIANQWMFCMILPPFFNWFAIHQHRKQLKLVDIYQAHGAPTHLKGKQIFPVFPKEVADGASSGIIGGLAGAWGWLLVLLLIGSFKHWSIAILFVLGLTLFCWLVAVGGRLAATHRRYVDFERAMGIFLWHACLIEASFFACILLLFFSPEIGELLLMAFQLNLTSAGIQTNLMSKKESLSMLWMVCPFILGVGWMIRWRCLARAELAERLEKNPPKPHKITTA